MAREDTVWKKLKVSKVDVVTEKAMKVTTSSGEEIWLPKSQVNGPEKFSKDQENVVIQISEWIATQKELSL